MAKMYTKEVGEQVILGNCTQSKRAGETRYLYSEAATYIASGNEIEGKKMEDKRELMRTECISG